MMSYKRNIQKLLYSNSQIGLVFILFFIILVHVPVAVYGNVFSKPMTTDDVNYYTKFGALFTMMGTFIAFVNTLIVIFLMYHFNKKESDIVMLSYINDLKKNLIDLEIVLRTEIDYFNNTQFQTNENLYISQNHDSGFNVYEEANLYIQEIESLNDIILEIKALYSIFLEFKLEINNQFNISIENYKEKIHILNELNEKVSLNKPSSEYKKGFIDGNKEDAEPEDMITVAKELSLNSIKNLKNVFKK